MSEKKEQYGKEHEQEVLRIFDKMVSDLGSRMTPVPDGEKKAEDAASQTSRRPAFDFGISADVDPWADDTADDGKKFDWASDAMPAEPVSGDMPATESSRMTRVFAAPKEKSADAKARDAELAYIEALKHAQEEVAYTAAASSAAPAEKKLQEKTTKKTGGQPTGQPAEKPAEHPTEESAEKPAGYVDFFGGVSAAQAHTAAGETEAMHKAQEDAGTSAEGAAVNTSGETPVKASAAETAEAPETVQEAETSENQTVFVGRAARKRAEKEPKKEKAPKKAGPRKKTEEAAAGYPDEDEEEEKVKEHSSGKKKKKRRKKKIFGKIVLALFLLCVVCCVIGGIFVVRYVYDEVKDLPEINPNNIYELLSENSVMLDADGNFMENVYSGNALRTNLSYEEFPEDLVNAFVCTEDKTFFDHHGFNFIRIAGAVVEKLTGQRSQIAGTSTITQQLARNLYLSDVKSERSLQRKLAEAYYTLVLEKSLTKEQILEAYLNTIYLGYNSNGVAAAAQAYFSKDVQDLSLMECACLATLPKSPNAYAPIKRVAADSVEDKSSLDIISEDDNWIVYYSDGGETRVDVVLQLMHDQGKILDSEYDEALEDSVRNYVNPGTNVMSATTTSYFADYVISQVVEDLVTELGLTEDEAYDKLYTGGLTINTTLNSTIQGYMEETYADLSNFPSVGAYKSDDDGNVLDSNGNVLLYNKLTFFDEEENFIIPQGQYQWEDNGDLKLLKGNRMNFYNTSSGGVEDVSIEFKNMFETDEIVVSGEGDDAETREMFFSQTGVLNIGSSYKTRDEEGNAIIAAQYFIDEPDAFSESPSGDLLLAHTDEDGSNEYYTLRQRVVQPQSAMTIINYRTGAIVGMVGGRGVDGKLLYNRATSTRQPGSSMKPIAVYSVALQAGKDGKGDFTAATPIDDLPISLSGNPWPKNWYTGYRGITNLRNAVEQSINACSVNLFMQQDMNMSREFVEGMGITSLVTTGSVNDMNASAFALGGMAHGVSPLEMSSAYGTFGNYGTHVEAVCYTTVVNKRGDIVLNKTPDTEKVMDEDVASLMTDILRTTVTHGLAGAAKISSQATAGKTGTTSDRYDIWFCGLTPKYSAAVWIGNDINIALDSGSGAATELWATVMEKVGALDEHEDFVKKGNFVTATVDRYSGKYPGDLTSLDPREDVLLTEIFIQGTEPKSNDDSHTYAYVCADTGYLATPSCEHVVKKLCVQRPGGRSWESVLNEYEFKKLKISSMPDAAYDVPDFYCPVHNPDVSTYPVSKLVEEGSSVYAGMTYEEVVPEYTYNEYGQPIDKWGNVIVTDADGNPLLDEFDQFIVYDRNGNYCTAGEDGSLTVIDTGAGLPTLPEGKEYLIDLSTGQPVLDENGNYVIIDSTDVEVPSGEGENTEGVVTDPSDSGAAGGAGEGSTDGSADGAADGSGSAQLPAGL